MGESPGAVEARASVGARPESAMRRPGGASTGGMDSERAVVSGRAGAADVVSRIITRVCAAMCAARRGRVFYVFAVLGEIKTAQRRDGGGDRGRYGCGGDGGGKNGKNLLAP